MNDCLNYLTKSIKKIQYEQFLHFIIRMYSSTLCKQLLLYNVVEY